jgi:hypothetical protein
MKKEIHLKYLKYTSTNYIYMKSIYNIKYYIKILILYVQQIDRIPQYTIEKYDIKINIMAFKVRVYPIEAFVKGNYATHER